ncbi:hypothetical protein KAR91_82875, partial [Candidatus Pacearchaeota archaeon]|nr:hypothetical protein [Candidatus Pacearchaeota archaeon]
MTKLVFFLMLLSPTVIAKTNLEVLIASNAIMIKNLGEKVDRISEKMDRRSEKIDRKIEKNAGMITKSRIDIAALTEKINRNADAIRQTDYLV